MTATTRRAFLAAAGATFLGGCRRGARGPVVGFAQIDTGGVWRAAETQSMREAAGRFELVVADAQDQTVKQIGDVEDFLARRAVAIFIAPREADGLEPAIEAARHANTPLFFIDREADGTPGVDYVTFLGSDFVAQGRRAAEWLVRAAKGRAGVAELTGTPGSSVARDRAAGFQQGIKDHPGVRVVASQTGSFARSGGQGVLANVLQAHGDAITAVFAHNDEMALGAAQAVRAAGKVPGRDVLIVSVDGQRTALEAIARGEIGCTVESNPRFGPAAFAALEDHLAGRPVPPRIVLADRLFDATNAEAAIPGSY